MTVIQFPRAGRFDAAAQRAEFRGAMQRWAATATAEDITAMAEAIEMLGAEIGEALAIAHARNIVALARTEAERDALIERVPDVSARVAVRTLVAAMTSDPPDPGVA